MSWEDLSGELGEIFAEHTEREYERQLSLEWWVTERLATRRTSHKSWRARNKERLRELRRNWRDSNREHALEYHRHWMRRWRAANAEVAREQNREHKRKARVANRERINEYQRNWRKSKHQAKPDRPPRPINEAASPAAPKARASSAHDIAGQRYGMLVAVRRLPVKGSRWVCKCDCGQESEVLYSNLKRGFTSSCGCRRLSGLRHVHNGLARRAA